MAPALAWARESYAHIERDVRDYTAKFVKQERVHAALADPEEMLLKVRHQQVRDGQVVVPFSVYLRFERPESIEGREVLFVAGQNDDQLLVQESPHTLTGMLVSTTALDPTGMLAMRGNRYPITEVGIKNLMRRLIEAAQADMQYDECEVNIDPRAVLGDQVCRLIEVVHPVRRPHFRYHLARIFVDDRRNVPLAYESYDWPQQAGQPPPLIEKYSYQHLQLNVGLDDRDFDTTNPDYHFK